MIDPASLAAAAGTVITVVLGLAWMRARSLRRRGRLEAHVDALEEAEKIQREADEIRTEGVADEESWLERARQRSRKRWFDRFL